MGLKSMGDRIPSGGKSWGTGSKQKSILRKEEKRFSGVEVSLGNHCEVWKEGKHPVGVVECSDSWWRKGGGGDWPEKPTCGAS